MALHVVIDRDWMDWVLFWVSVGSLVATACAAVLALWAVRAAKRTAREADEALVRERRAAFELAVLARVGEVFGLRVAGSADALRGLLLTLPDEDLPTLRTFLCDYLDSTMPNTDDIHLRQQFRDELSQAVDLRTAHCRSPH